MEAELAEDTKTIFRSLTIKFLGRWVVICQIIGKAISFYISGPFEVFLKSWQYFDN